MRVYIPPNSDDAVELPYGLDELLDGIRLSELEKLDEILNEDQMTRLLEGQIGLDIMRPVVWLRLRRDYPDVELDGFDVEIVAEDGDESDSGKA